MILHTASTQLDVSPGDVKILGGNTVTGERIFIEIAGRRYNAAYDQPFFDPHRAFVAEVMRRVTDMVNKAIDEEINRMLFGTSGPPLPPRPSAKM